MHKKRELQLIDLLILALALSAGFFGISYNGSRLLKSLKGKTLLIPLVFGIVSTTFLSLGLFLGFWLKGYFINYESHLAFFVLAAIGIKTFLEGTGKKKSHTVYLLENNKIVFGAAIIYSINYLIAGICMFLYKGEAYILFGAFIIISIAASLFGLLLGRMIKNHISDFVLITGGIMLIAMATKILLSQIGYI